MFGITLSVAEITGAPPNVRHWLEAEIARTLGLRPACGGFHAGDNSGAKPMLAAQDGLTTTGDAKMGLVTEPVPDEALRKLIAVRAYELWENQGRPHGYDRIN